MPFHFTMDVIPIVSWIIHKATWKIEAAHELETGWVRNISIFSVCELNFSLKFRQKLRNIKENAILTRWTTDFDSFDSNSWLRMKEKLSYLTYLLILRLVLLRLTFQIVENSISSTAKSESSTRRTCNSASVETV